MKRPSPGVSSRLLAILVAFTAVLSPALVARAEEPASFARELALLRRYVACDERTADAEPPRGLKPAVVKNACKEVKRRVDIFRKRWLEKARPFLESIVPRNLPKRVLYPFGGADLLHALVVYPDAELITTLSLEWVGDPRAVAQMDAAALTKNMKQQHAFLIKLFQVNHSRTLDLQALNASPVPAPLVFALVALELLGYEPVDARWFELGKGGEVVYLTPSAIAAFDKTPAGRKQRDRNAFFANVEVRFRKSGAPGAPVQVWRHMRANLHDDHLRDSPVSAYLKAQGQVAAMMKAASYLIWREDFSLIRNILLDQMAWMISETSGIAPYHAAEKGFVQDVWGRFTGNMFPGPKKAELAMIELWKSRPERKTPIQFGYPDKIENDHVLVTRRP
jgi:hypothetical protein